MNVKLTAMFHTKIILWILFRTRNVSEKSCREN